MSSSPSAISWSCIVVGSWAPTFTISYLMRSKPHQGRMTRCPRCGFLLTTRQMTSPVWLEISNYWQISVQQQQFNTVFSTIFPTYRSWYLTWTVGRSSRLRQQLLDRMPSQGVCWQQSKPVMDQDLCEAGKRKRCMKPTSSCRVRQTSPSSSQSQSVEMSSYSLGRSQGMKGSPTGRGKGRAQLQYLRGSDFWLRMKYRWSLSPLQSNIIKYYKPSQRMRNHTFCSLREGDICVWLCLMIYIWLAYLNSMQRVEESEQRESHEMMERDNQEAEAEKLQEWETRRRRQEYGFDNRSCFVMVALLAVLVLAFMAFQYSLDYRTGHKEIQESEEREGTAKIGPITANPQKTTNSLQKIKDPLPSTAQQLENEANLESTKPVTEATVSVREDVQAKLAAEEASTSSGRGEGNEFKKVIWIQTDDELQAKKMEIAVAAQNLIHFAEGAGYEVRVVNNFNSYEWLSQTMVELIRQTHQKSKIDLPVYQLLRLALLIEHGGISVRLPELILLEDLTWVEKLLSNDNLTISEHADSLSCKKKEIEVLIHHQSKEGFRYQDEFTAARKNSSLMRQILKDVASIAKNGTWPYSDFNVTTVNNDTEVITMPGITSALINVYRIQMLGRGNHCEKYRLQSFDEASGIFMTVPPKTASELVKMDEQDFKQRFGRRLILRLKMQELVNDIALIIKTGDLSIGKGNSLLKNKIMMAKGNQWLTKPKEKLRKVHFCIISLKTAKVLESQDELKEQMKRLERQTFKSWNVVNFIENLASPFEKLSERTTFVNASVYEGLNLQRAATKYCEPDSLAFLLNYDESLSTEDDLQVLADHFKQVDVFGAFLRVKTLTEEFVPSIAKEIRRRTYQPDAKLLHTIGNLFRVFTVQSYRFIAHFDLRHSSGRYFDREIPFLSMLEISEHFSPCEKGNIVYQVRRLEEFMAIPKKRLQINITIHAKTLKTVNMQHFENYGKLRYRHICGTIQFYQEYVAPVETMAVFNDGQEFEGLSSREGKAAVIPKKIHQIWVRGQIPQFKQFLMKRLRDAHPDYQYFIWSEDNITRENFPQGYDLMQTLIEWDKRSPYNKMSVVSDIMRSQIVYNHGGFYLDTNYMLFQDHSLDQFLSYSFVTAGELSQRQRFFRDTAIFGAIQHSPRVGRLINHKTLSTRNFYSKRAAKEAGPGLFGKTLLGKEEQDPEVFQPGFEEFYPNFLYDPGNSNRNRCEADSRTPASDILFRSSRAYVKYCDEIYPYAFGLDFFAQGLSWQKRKWR